MERIECTDAFSSERTSDPAAHEAAGHGTTAIWDRRLSDNLPYALSKTRSWLIILHPIKWPTHGVDDDLRARVRPPEAVAEERYFTAEHVFRWMWQDYSGLHSHRAAAEILADHPWPRLY